MNPFLWLILIGGFALMNMSAKKDARNLIKNLEGYSAFEYLDTAGIPTIGWGHKILPNEDFSNGITQEQAEKLLSQDMQFAENTVNYYVSAPINQLIYDALVSFVYNVGAQAFANSTLLKKLNIADYESAAEEFTRWKYITVNGVKTVSQGLLNRRIKEQSLFKQGLPA